MRMIIGIFMQGKSLSSIDGDKKSEVAQLEQPRFLLSGRDNLQSFLIFVGDDAGTNILARLINLDSDQDAVAVVAVPFTTPQSAVLEFTNLSDLLVGII